MVDQGSKFKNYLSKKFLGNNKIEMHSTWNEKKIVFAQRFIRTLKNKFYKHITAVSGDLYFHVLVDIVNKYSSIVHRTVKIKPIDVNI